jgi:hypothetical protein
MNWARCAFLGHILRCYRQKVSKRLLVTMAPPNCKRSSTASPTIQNPSTHIENLSKTMLKWEWIGVQEGNLVPRRINPDIEGAV